ncbi:MAG: 3'-5' exonuclease [Hafnia sp.]
MRADYTKINCFDMEMCCWGEGERRVGEIISIGVTELCLLTGRSLQEAHYYVKPEKDEVSEYCSELTGITQVMVNKQGRALHQVLDTMKRKFGGNRKTYVAWGTDADYLNNECLQKGIESPISKTLNAALLYMIRTRHNGGQISMIKAMNDAGLEFEGKQHNALVDAKNLSRLIYAKNLI